MLEKPGNRIKHRLPTAIDQSRIRLDLVNLRNLTVAKFSKGGLDSKLCFLNVEYKKVAPETLISQNESLALL